MMIHLRLPELVYKSSTWINSICILCPRLQSTKTLYGHVFLYQKQRTGFLKALWLVPCIYTAETIPSQQPVWTHEKNDLFSRSCGSRRCVLSCTEDQTVVVLISLVSYQVQNRVYKCRMVSTFLQVLCWWNSSLCKVQTEVMEAQN